MKILAMLLTCAAAFLAGPGTASELRIGIGGLRSTDGYLRVAVCPENLFTRPECPHVASAPAGTGMVTVTAVPVGVYAVQAFHDENGNGELDRHGWRPAEGLAFSNDAPMRRGPPRFSEAAIEVRESGALRLNMRYPR